MRKIKFICAVVFILSSISSYLFYSFDIYSSPQIKFSSPNVNIFQPLNSQCSQARIPPPVLSQNKFQLLVWNMHKGKDAGWQQALEQFSQNADFLLLQEVANTQNLMARFSTQYPTSLYASSFAYLGEQSGVKLLAKATPDLFCVDMEKEPWIIIPKVGSVLRFPLSNQRSLLIINLHLINFELNLVSYRKQIDKILAFIGEHKGPIIIGGDFNTWNKERLTLVQELVKILNLKEVDYQPDIRMQFLGNPLDHIFVRDLRVIQAKTIETKSSDHNPLIIEVELED